MFGFLRKNTHEQNLDEIRKYRSDQIKELMKKYKAELQQTGTLSKEVEEKYLQQYRNFVNAIK